MIIFYLHDFKLIIQYSPFDDNFERNTNIKKVKCIKDPYLQKSRYFFLPSCLLHHLQLNQLDHHLFSYYLLLISHLNLGPFPLMEHKDYSLVRQPTFLEVRLQINLALLLIPLVHIY